MSIAKWLLAKKLGGGSPFPPVIKRVTGNPIEFTDGADAPLVKCVTEITGSQDLHGYDKPWVGGAGKNKLPITLANLQTYNTIGTWANDKYTLNGVTFSPEVDSSGYVSKIIVNGTASTSGTVFIFLPNGTHNEYIGLIQNGGVSNQCYITGWNNTDGVSIGVTDYGNGFTIPSELQDKIYRLYIAIPNGSIVTNAEVKPMISVSGGAYAPYSNLCPITAYDENTISVVGKNRVKQIVQGYINKSTGLIKIDNDTETVLFYANEGDTYTVSAGDSLDRSVVGYVGVDTLVNGAPVSNITDLVQVRTWTATWTGWTAWYIRASISAVVEQTAQVEKGGTATSYEAPNFTTHTTTYPSAIYRGSEDVVKGEVTSDMPVIDLGDLSWSYSNDNNCFRANLSNMMTYSLGVTPIKWKCSCYEVTSAKYLSNMSNVTTGQLCPQVGYTIIMVKDTRYTDATTFTTAITGQTLAYELATPTTSSVTPTNLPIKSLSGYNHIESSTGDMEIDYITDAYQNFVDTVESALPNTRKGGTKAMDVFLSLEKRNDKEEVKEETKDDMR